MAYREDSDLVFLRYCDQEDLSLLVEFLTKTKSGRRRLTEELTSKERFKKRKSYKEVWDLIAGELQCFGADTIMTMVRGGKGTFYRKILVNVCNKLKVNYDKKSDIEMIENNLLLVLVEKSLEKMTAKEKREFAMQMNLIVPDLSTVAIMAALQGAVRLGGFASYQMALIIANSTAKFIAGRGLAIAANAGLVRGLAIIAGPVGLVISGLTALPMITGAAYRVTIPSVIQVSYMRKKLMASQEGII